MYGIGSLIILKIVLHDNKELQVHSNIMHDLSVELMFRFSEVMFRYECVCVF